MADSPLNNSWPSFSKLWMKRWSFKRGSEGKPCAPPATLGSGTESSSSLSPSSIAEDVFFTSLTEEQSPSSTESDYENPGQDVDSSTEDLLNLDASLRDSEFFRDLQPEPVTSQGPPTTALSIVITPVGEHTLNPTLHVYQIVDQGSRMTDPAVSSYNQLNWQFSSNMEQQHSDTEEPTVTVNTTVQLGDPEAPEAPTAPEPLDYSDPENPDNIPMLVRSMSTSRRHSWGTPVSPIDLGRRLSLDTSGIDSDGESTHHPQFVFPVCPEDVGNDTALQEESDSTGRTLCAKSDMLASDERSRAARVSRILETSSQAAKASGEEQDLEDRLQSEEGQSHLLMVQKVLQELKQYHGAKSKNRSSDQKPCGSVTWYEFLSNEPEEEEEKTEKSEKGTKVKRTLSSLRNRMTGSFNKDKGKNREKEREQQKERGKEREKDREEKERGKGRRGSTSGHQLVPGSFSTYATCSLCSKTLQGKHGMQCLNCAVNVHKSCKSLLAECSSSKHKFRESVKTSGPAQTIKDQPCAGTSSHHQHQSPQQQQQQQTATTTTLHPWAADGSCRPPRAPGMTITPRGPSATTSNSSLNHCSSSGSLPGEMDETEGRIKRFAEDTVSLAPSTTESIIVDEDYFAGVRVDLEADAQDYELESWSRAVDQQYLKTHSKEAIKRQDVIFELIQTEVHHVRTLKTMLRVYLHELRDALHSQERRLFPRLEGLLELHTHFLSRLKERRSQSLQPGSDRNYNIPRLADILVSQFSGESGERMKECYGDFCSHHSEAVSFYKEQLQSNKKFQNQIRKIGNLSIVRRLGVPECILLVTQRITKYPVLVERILQNTEAGSEEQEELTRALGLIKEVITQVDTQVSDYEKASRLRDIASKVEPKSHGKIKDGRVFRREDLGQGRRRLLHEGTVNWKAASGRLKDILAVLLTDVLILLQEKDQRFVFSTVDNKPSVISLQKLIVREVAHEEKAMFLICASSNEPEMYEIHTTSKEERNTWMTHIRQAVESCPTTEERLFSEEEEARAVRFKEFQERLNSKDSQISQILTEKLELFADMAASVGTAEDAGSRSRLLLRGDTSDLQQGEQLLKGAITEVENLQNLLLSRVREPAPRSEESQGSGVLPRRADTFGGYDSSPSILQKNGGVKKTSGGLKSRERSQRASSDPQLKELKELCGSQGLAESSPPLSQVDGSSPASWNPSWTSSFPESEQFLHKVLQLSQRLYSLQAIVAQQDSHLELQRASLSERERPGGGRHRLANVLLEQEKQRNLEKQREELAHFHKLQSQHRKEQASWERERERHRRREAEAEARLQRREDECRRLEARLAEEREELERQRQTYQEDLERLRESTRAVEREKERLEQQKKLKKHNTLPSGASAGLFAGQEAGQHLPMSSSFNGELLLGMGPSVDPAMPPKPLVRSSLSISPADYAERPEVKPAVAGKSSEVPIHLISTTNQLHKQGAVQQQIPTKLAALSKGKEKGGKGKGSHRTESSASVDMKQMLPMKLSARDDSSLRAKRSISPSHQIHIPPAEPANPPEVYYEPPPPTPQPLHPSITHRPPSQLQNLPPPPYKITEDVTKEDVIFF